MQQELIKNKLTWNPVKLPNDVLLDDHRILHAWWATEQKGKDIKGWSKEDISNAHKLAAAEMDKRKLGIDKDGSHDSPLPNISEFDQPFPAWKRDGKKGEYGPMLFLPNVSSVFTGDYMLCEDFITIVGGLCAHGQTKGDVDILIKTTQPSERSPLGMATQFRLARTLAKIGIPESRIQFLYDDFSGPFTSHMHLYDLVLRRKKTRELHEMADASAVVPFKFVVQPKPIMGRFKEEIFSVDSVIEVIKTLRNWGEEAVQDGVFVEVKKDGFRIQAHKQGKKLIIWTEEHNEVTSKLPTIANLLIKVNHDFVIEGEVELWLNGNHQNRADASSILQSKTVPPQEKNLTLSCYDIMFLDGHDVHDETFEKRHKLLSECIPNGNILSVTKSTLATSLDQLKTEVINASKTPGSEGAMIKKRDYIYPLKLHTSDMIKFKNEFSINVVVVDSIKVKGSENTYSYIVALKDGTQLVPAGKTFNTDIHVPISGALKVVFVEISKYIDPSNKKVHYNMFAPRVVAKADKGDSIQTADELVKKSGGQIQQRPFPTRFKNLLEDNDYILEFMKQSLLWDTEELDFSIVHNWLQKDLIPDELALSNHAELRNNDNFLLKKSIGDKAVIFLRNNKNDVMAEKIVSLYEV